MVRFFTVLLVLSLVSLLPGMVEARQGATVAHRSLFGGMGHQECASIAAAYLTPNTQLQMASLIPELAGGSDISTIASWADSVKAIYVWSARLHFINLPDGICLYNRTRDCADYTPSNKAYTQKTACLAGAITNYTSQLATKQLNGKAMSPAALAEAAKFLVHYLGDIHQPLHTGWSGDAGGNAYTGTFGAANSVTLHAVWDQNILARRDNDFGGTSGYIQYLINQVNASNPNAVYKQNLTTWTSCGESTIASECPHKWAQEAMDASCKYAYVDTSNKLVKDGFNLQDPYYNRAVPILDGMMAKCGYRLAFILNTLFSAIAPPPPPVRGTSSVLFLLRFTYDEATTNPTFASGLLNDLSSAVDMNVTRFVLREVQKSTAAGTIIVIIDVLDSDTEAGVVGANRLITALNDPDSTIYAVERPTSSEAVTGSAAIQDASGGGSNNGGSTGGAGAGGGGGGGGGGTETIIEKSGPLSVPLVVGLIIGLAVVLGVALFVLWLLLRSRNVQHQSTQERLKDPNGPSDLEFGTIAAYAPSRPAAAPPAQSAPPSDMSDVVTSNPLVDAVKIRTNAHGSPPPLPSSLPRPVPVNMRAAPPPPPPRV